MPKKTIIQAPPAPNGKGLGWRPDIPDVRDYPLRMAMGIRAEASLPRKVSLREKMTAVRDQHNTNACVGFSTAAAVSYLRQVDADRFNTEHSPFFAYYMARLLEDEVNKSWVKVDQGAYIRFSVKALTRFGNPPESNWPFIPDKVTREPTKSAYKAAERWKLGGYFRCANAQEVMNALAQGYPVIGGFSCYNNMFTSAVSKSGDIPMPTSTSYNTGGHAVCFTGYDMDTARFEFKNSWGTEWGKGGYGSLPFAFVNNPNLADDFWALVGESDETNAMIRKVKVAMADELPSDGGGSMLA